MGEQAVMQHLRISQDDICVRTSPSALLSGRVPVVSDGVHALDIELAESTQLVLG